MPVTTMTLSNQNNPSSAYALLSTSLAPGNTISAVWNGFGGCEISLYRASNGTIIRDGANQPVSVTGTATRRSGNAVSLTIPMSVSAAALTGAVLLVKNPSFNYDSAITLTTPNAVTRVLPPFAVPSTVTFARNQQGRWVATITITNSYSLGVDSCSYTVADRSATIARGYTAMIASGEGLRVNAGASRVVVIPLPLVTTSITVAVRSASFGGIQTITRNFRAQ